MCATTTHLLAQTTPTGFIAHFIIILSCCTKLVCPDMFVMMQIFSICGSWELKKDLIWLAMSMVTFYSISQPISFGWGSDISCRLLLSNRSFYIITFVYSTTVLQHLCFCLFVFWTGTMILYNNTVHIQCNNGCRKKERKKEERKRNILWDYCLFVCLFFLVVVVVEFFSDYCFSEFLTLTTTLFKSKVKC